LHILFSLFGCLPPGKCTKYLVVDFIDFLFRCVFQFLPGCSSEIEPKTHLLQMAKMLLGPNAKPLCADHAGAIPMALQAGKMQ